MFKFHHKNYADQKEHAENAVPAPDNLTML